MDAIVVEVKEPRIVAVALNQGGRPIVTAILHGLCSSYVAAGPFNRESKVYHMHVIVVVAIYCIQLMKL